MDQMGDSGDSMLKCLGLLSIALYCGIQRGGTDPLSNLLGNLTQSRMASKLVSLGSSLVILVVQNNTACCSMTCH